MTNDIIDLSQVPVPDVIQEPDFENELSELKAIAIGINPEFSETLDSESEPLTMLLQVFAYRGIVYQQRLNDAVRSTLLASAKGADLDAKASDFNQTRLVIKEADPNASPPVEEVREDDDSFRRRVQLSFNSLNTAGAEDGYVFHALSADPMVRDVNVRSPEPCVIDLPILSRDGDGTASTELLNTVRAHFGVSPDEQSTIDDSAKLRPIGDRLTVRSADIVPFQVVAKILLPRGPSGAVLLERAQQRLNDYLKDNKKLGVMVSRSVIIASLYQDGAINVYLDEPSADIHLNWDQAGHCSNVQIEVIHEVPAAT